MKRLVPIVALLMASGPALAHIGHSPTVSFTAGLGHPFGGFDHVAAMVAVGLWAALKGGRALWVWPAAFVGVMLIGGAMGMAHLPLPFVEPGILASVIVLGLLVALAVDLPLGLGAVIVASFALLHGYGHGSEVEESANGALYMAGFALATAALHLAGIGFAQTMKHLALRPAVRLAGAACALAGVASFAGAL
jgi:urease accessory protein